MCVLRPCRQKGTQSLWYEPRIFGSRTAASVAIDMCMWQSDPNQDKRANHVGSTLLECIGSDADASVVIVLRQWLNQLWNYSRDTSKINTHRSLRTRPRQDCTHRVMLNDCISARWSPMYHYLVLTLLRDSHPLPTRHIRELIGGFSSHFRISVSVLRFPFSVFHLPTNTRQMSIITRVCWRLPI